MRKFKLFIASMLTYFMAISLLPTSLMQTIAKAAENEYTTVVKSDYYLRDMQQYREKSIAVRNKQTSITISLFNKDKETILKQINKEDGIHTNVTQHNIGNGKVQFIEKCYEYSKVYVKNIYEFDFNTDKLITLPQESYNNGTEFKLGEYRSLYQGKDPNFTFLFKDIVDRLNKKYGENYSLDMFDGNNANIYFEIRDKYKRELINIDTEFLKLEDCIIDFTVSIQGEEGRYFRGIFNSEFEIIDDGTEKPVNISFLYGKNGIKYILKQVSQNKSLVYELEGNSIKSTKELDFDINNLWRTIDINENFIFIDSRYETNEIIVLSLENGVYKDNGIRIKASLRDGYGIDKDGKLWLASVDGKDIVLSKFENNNLVTKNRLVGLIEKEDLIFPIIPNVYDENNIIVSGSEIGNIFINKKQEPEIPNKPEEPNTPGDNGNVVVIPSDDKVVEEVSKINPNDKNEIKVNTEASAKTVEVLIKDVESFKSGTGSLNITINNGVTMNLPLSTIDKSLLEGADNVTIKLDIVENSDIIKQIKAVNKVFDFNLIINKGNESLNIHNFKDGLAEVTLNLTDEDLKELNKDKLVVYYYNDVEKTFEAMETVVNGNKITFKTSHFSKYVVAEKVTDTNGGSSPSEGANDNTNNNTETGKGNLPETGSVVSNNVILVLAIGIVAIGGIMFFRKRKHA